MWLKASCEDFSYDFIRGVVEGNGSKSGEGGGTVLFGYKSEEGRVCKATDILLSLYPHNHFYKVLFDEFPKGLEKTNGKSIWTRRLV